MTPPLIDCSMEKEKVRNKREHFGCQETAKKSKQAKAEVLKESTDKFLQIIRSGGRRSRLVRPFEKNLNLTIIGPTRTLKLQGFDHK